ncbi:MAG: hypothetical protein QOH06_1639 [Acidobacteriota bacterium]|jgi:uncharacterized repeat protein (TIGR01451 family)|nr:hypothetical protein [Acidobacteriota bacterium]
MTRLRSLAPFLLSALLGSALQAQPFLVEDIWSPSISARWDFPRFAEVGGIVYFTAEDGIHGTELWRSDGTAAGTWLVKDICAGICSSGVSWMDAAGGALYLGANDGFHGPALWKSDGTAAGTVPVRVGVEVHDTIGEVGGVLLFVGSLPGGSKELWRSDGTQAGTVSLSASASDPVPLGYAGSLLLFSAEDPEHGRELWKTDGTAAGTAFVEDLTPGTDTSFSSFRPFHRKFFPAVGGRLFFPAGPRLWVSDGTPEGTYQAADVPLMTVYETSYLAVLGDAVYFSGHDPDHGVELWRSDATAAGTFRVKDLNPGTEGSYPAELVEAGGTLYFRTVSDNDPDPALWTLWKSDGTEEGTVPVKPGAVLNLVYDYSALMALGTGVVFFASDGALGDEPWYSDGTGAGTQMLADAYPGSLSSHGGFFFPLTRIDGGVVTGGQWFFRARTPAGWTLWRSDGTQAGTQLVKQMDDAQGSGLPPSPKMIDLEGTLLFSANDGNTGQELWSSDGTVPGTSLVTDLNPGAPWSSPADLTAFGGFLYFSAWPNNLMRTDGTEAGTEFVGGSFRRELVVAGPGLYYVCVNGFSEGICRADGPFIQTIWGFSIGLAASQLTPAGSNLFFNGWTEDGQELWKTNGVMGGDVKLEIVPGTGSSNPQSIAAFGSSVLFSADDGITGRELWFSDGTPAGTRRVKDILPGAGSSNPRSIVVAGSVAFFIADDVLTGGELWRSDGTTAGTFRVRDIRPGIQSSSIQGLTAFGDSVVLFAADNGTTGHELWASYGSADAAFMVKDIQPGAGSSFPGGFRRVGHTVLFAADDGTHGLEPWQTDGFAAGTFLVHDVFPGPEPSSPSGFTLSGDYLFFAANDGTHGFELWAVDRVELGSTLAATKRVMSPTYPGAAVTYEIVITNTGAGPHPDNPGAEMADMLPTGLALTGASSDVGTLTLDLPNNVVSWNGALAPGESATVLVHATLSPSAIEYGMIFNQASVNYDSNGDGINEKTGVSNDPGRPDPDDPTLATVSTPPLDFHTVTPCRVLDTRTSSPLASGVLQTFAVGGICGIPPAARAVAVNVTVLGATGSGHLVLHPAGIPHSVPITSTANFTPVRARANNAMLPLASGAVDATATVVGGGTVHLILDVNGYYE